MHMKTGEQLRGDSFPSTLMCVLGIGLKSPGLCGKYLYLASHPAGLHSFLIVVK